MKEESKVAETASMQAEVQTLIDGSPVLVMATSTCPFCIEAKRTLAAHGIAGRFVDLDKEANGSEMRKAMTSLAANRTSVPQIWINKKHIGGCDDLKALDAAGDLGLQLNGVPREKTVADAEEGAPALKEEHAGVSRDAAVAIYPGPEAAFFAPFHSPATVDHRVVRVNAVITFIIAVFAAVFAGRRATEWVVLGLFVDFGLKLTGFPSPVGLLAALPFAGTKPHFSAGASKQFANLCGIFFASVSWACLVGDKSIGARIMLAMLAGAAFLQGFLDFCAGCFIFEYLLKWGLISKSVYRMHVNTRADLVYAWEKNNVSTGKEVSPEAVTYPTRGLPPNPTDLCAKPGKEDDKWQRFNPIKYCHVSYFMVPLSVLGLALPWALVSDILGTDPIVWQVLAWTGVCIDATLWTLYVSKCVMYTSKVKKEWYNPIQHNSFALPFLNCILMSWLATRWTGASFSGDLAKVLFWMGTAPLCSLTIFTIASWVAVPVDLEYTNPSWMLMPVGNLLGAVAARRVDPDYAEWGWFLFSVGAFLWLALWPITFRRAVASQHSDFRLRSLYGVWVAPPAVAMLAYSSLEDLDTFGPVQRVLFYASLCIALVLATCAWPMNFFLEGKFDMSCWAFAFPLDALAGASVTVYGLTRYDTMRVIYVLALTTACLVNTVNMLFTLGALKSKHIFTPLGKWSPLSFMKLTHEAFRQAVLKLDKLAAAATPGAEGASTLREIAAAWSSMAKAHDVHAMHEDKVIFPTLEGFFPGQTQIASEEHEEHEQLMKDVQTGIDALLRGADGKGNGGGGGGGDDKATRAALLDELKANLSRFGKELLDHLDHEEHSFATPVARKYLPLQTSKELVRKSWDATSHSDMSELLGWVLATLRARGQRTRFLKTWVWAMPERAQQVGLMVYRVVDDVTWVEVARDLPEVVPRGLPGYRRYF